MLFPEDDLEVKREQNGCVPFAKAGCLCCLTFVAFGVAGTAYAVWKDKMSRNYEVAPVRSNSYFQR